MSFSVVVPTYNSNGLLRATLQAILAQTAPADDIIVVDDGGSDDTEQLARTLPVRYLRVDNGGPGRARNAGVAVAKSEWIAFCDHDDLWRPTYLERFQAKLRPGSFYGFSNWVDLIEDRWTKQEKFSGAPTGFFDNLSEPLYEKLTDFVPIWPSATLIRRDFFLDIGGFNPRFSRFATEDFEFSLRCNEHAPAVVMHEPLVGIRKHGGNYSRGRVRQNLSDAAILAWARDNHRMGKSFQAKMDRSVVARRVVALNEAFLSGELNQVREIAGLLPRGALNTMGLLKVMIAKSRFVPAPVVRALFGRPKELSAAGAYGASPATPQ